MRPLNWAICAFVGAISLVTPTTPVDSPQLVAAANPSETHRYLVVLRERPSARNDSSSRIELAPLALGVANSYGGRVTRTYDPISFSASMELTNPQAKRMALDPRVASVSIPRRIFAANGLGQTTYTQIFSPSLYGDWGLARIDEPEFETTTGVPDVFEPSVPHFSESEFHYTFTGAGTLIYVLDRMPPGAQPVGAEFQNRMAIDQNYAPQGECDGGLEDFVDGTFHPRDHGMFVSGLAAGSKRGVAKLASIRVIRTLCSVGFGGDVTDVLGALNAVHANYIQLPIPRPRAVVNMSFGWPYATADVDQNNEIRGAMQTLVDDDIVIVVAAGNRDWNACQTMPARFGVDPSNLTFPGVGMAGVITVAASKRVESGASVRDRKSAISNWGPCVDLFAPGADVRSVLADGNEAVSFGTSFAAPLVAGVVATYLEQYPKSSALWIESKLLSRSSWLEQYVSGDDFIIDPVLDESGHPMPRTANRVVFSGWFRRNIEPDEFAALPPPNTLSGPALAESSFGVTWQNSGSGIGYQLLETRNASFFDQRPAYENTGTSASLTRSLGTYYYRVRSCSSDFTACGEYGPQTIAVNVKASASDWPHLFDSTESGTSYTGQYTVIWSSLGDGISYVLERATGTNGAFSSIYSGTALSKSESIAVQGIRRYRVKACLVAAPSVCGPYSPISYVETDLGI